MPIFIFKFLAKKNNLNIVSYFNYCILSAPLSQTISQKIKWNLGKFLIINIRIYKSIGSRFVIRPKINDDTKKLEINIAKSIFNKIRSKADILKIKIEGVRIGDLVYDTYLKSNQVAFVDIKKDDFYQMLKDFCSFILLLEKFFDENNVHSIIGVHSVYSYGLPLRIAISKKIKAYTINSRD